MEIRIAPADEADWAGIWTFFRPIVRAGETYTYDPDITEDAARRSWMQQPPGRTYVAIERDGTIVGSAKLHPNQGGPGSHVANASYMVDPAHAGQGIGRAMCEHTITAARAEGYRAIVFNAVAATNVHAVRLYESLGFEVLATIPDGFRHPTAGYVGLHVMYLAL